MNIHKTRMNNSGKLPEKPHGSMNWLPDKKKTRTTTRRFGPGNYAHSMSLRLYDNAA